MPSYSVFQTERDLNEGSKTPEHEGHALGFLGRVLDGTGLVAVSVFVALVTLTTASRADALFESAAIGSNTVMMVAVSAVFAALLAAVRSTWRRTAKEIGRAPRRSHRIG